MRKGNYLVRTETPVSVTAPAQVFAVQSGNSSLHAFVAHHIRVLSHGGQDEAVLNQAQDGVGLVKANHDDGAVSSLVGIAGAGGGTFVAAEDAHNAPG